MDRIRIGSVKIRIEKHTNPKMVNPVVLIQIRLKWTSNPKNPTQSIFLSFFKTQSSMKFFKCKKKIIMFLGLGSEVGRIRISGSESNKYGLSGSGLYGLSNQIFINGFGFI